MKPASVIQATLLCGVLALGYVLWNNDREKVAAVTQEKYPKVLYRDDTLIVWKLNETNGRCIYVDRESSRTNVFYQSHTTNAGESWSIPERIVAMPIYVARPEIIINDDGAAWIMNVRDATGEIYWSTNEGGDGGYIDINLITNRLERR